MSIVSFNTQTPGLVGVAPRIVQLVTTDNLATITTAGYLNKQGQVLEGISLIPTDEVHTIYNYVASTNSGTFEVFIPSISATGVITLTADVSGGNVLLPVVSGDFATFNGTSGQIKDAGYLPSNAAKTVVVMANAATVADHIMVSTDTTGTVGNKTGTAINDGSLQAGRDTVAGSLISFPATTTAGSLAVTAVANSGAFNGVISNVALGQSSTWSLPDPGNAAARILVAATATPFVSGNLVQASGTGGLTIDSGIAGSGLQILSASVTLNQADVQGAYGTPIQIIAASANKVIVPVQATIYTNFQTAAFAGGGVAILQYDNTIHGAGTNALAATIPAAEITAGASQIYSEAGVVASALTGITNKGLFFSNQTGAFTNGNAASTVVVTVSYYLVTATV